MDTEILVGPTRFKKIWLRILCSATTRLISEEIMGVNIICNFNKCRKPLSTIAWVTSCSHAFCADHGESEFGINVQNALSCPACNSRLTEKYDVVQADLSPSESFKSIIMAGMQPDTIMDIAVRAVTFWSYQVEEERKYLENVARHAQERITNLEKSLNFTIQQLQVELNNVQRKIENLQIEYNKQKLHLEEKNRKIQKLQYDLGYEIRKSMHLHQTVKVENPHELTSKFIFQPHIVKQPYENQQSEKNVPLENNDEHFLFNPVIKRFNHNN